MFQLMDWELVCRTTATNHKVLKRMGPPSGIKSVGELDAEASWSVCELTRFECVKATMASLQACVPHIVEHASWNATKILTFLGCLDNVI